MINTLINLINAWIVNNNINPIVLVGSLLIIAVILWGIVPLFKVYK